MMGGRTLQALVFFGNFTTPVVQNAVACGYWVLPVEGDVLLGVFVTFDGGCPGPEVPGLSACGWTPVAQGGGKLG